MNQTRKVERDGMWWCESSVGVVLRLKSAASTCIPPSIASSLFQPTHSATYFQGSNRYVRAGAAQVLYEESGILAKARLIDFLFKKFLIKGKGVFHTNFSITVPEFLIFFPKSQARFLGEALSYHCGLEYNTRLKYDINRKRTLYLRPQRVRASPQCILTYYQEKYNTRCHTSERVRPSSGSLCTPRRRDKLEG